MSMVGRPSNDDFIAITKTNMIEIFPVKLEGVKIAKKVFGPESDSFYYYVAI